MGIIASRFDMFDDDIANERRCTSISLFSLCLGLSFLFRTSPVCCNAVPVGDGYLMKCDGADTASSATSDKGVSICARRVELEQTNLQNQMEAVSKDEQCSSADMPSNSNALVLYTPSLLEPFHRVHRTFHLAGREFSIKQNWADFGVAAVVWDAAIVLCEYLESRCVSGDLTLDGKQVIELGAGTGLVGMVAATLKGHTTITDRESVLEPLRENVVMNFSPSTSSSCADPKPASASSSNEATTQSPLYSPSLLPATSPLPPQTVPTVQALDWGQKLHEYPQPFDIILGADIVYVEDTFQDLLQTLVHLSNKDTLILLSCRIRYERDEHFLSMLKENFDVSHELHDHERGIEVYSARKVTS